MMINELALKLFELVKKGDLEMLKRKDRAKNLLALEQQQGP